MSGHAVYVQPVDKTPELRGDGLSEDDAIGRAEVLSRQARVNQWNAVWVEGPGGVTVWDAAGRGLIAPPAGAIGDPRDAPGAGRDAGPAA